MPNWTKRPLGVVALIILPFLLAVWLILEVEATSISSQTLILPLFAAAIYVVYLQGDSGYDAKKIRSLDVNGLPEYFIRVATETTAKGDRLYELLLKAFDHTKVLSQSGLYEEVGRQGVDLSRPQVAKYIDNLVEMGLIEAPPKQYEYKYSLTDRGRWCRKVIDQLLPKETLHLS